MVPKMEQEMIEDVLPLCVSGGIKAAVVLAEEVSVV